MERYVIRDTFRPRLLPHWNRTAVGGGQFAITGEGLRLLLTNAQRTRYADAQIDDYGRLPRRRFPWRPPLRLVVQARASAALAGTAGFGFWNNPFSPLGGWPALPAAIWFFYASPPSDMSLAPGVPGSGWKAACIDATRPSALAWAPFSLPIIALNRIPHLYHRIWPIVQRSLNIAEAAIPPLGETWQLYTLEWHTGAARFAVDGMVVLETSRTPQGPLGFVAWVDNQWMVVTPQGRFGWGLLSTGTQWMDLRQVRIEKCG